MRFIGLGPYSLDVEVTAYVKTSNFDEFLAIQQELLLAMLSERSMTSFLRNSPMEFIRFQRFRVLEKPKKT